MIVIPVGIDFLSWTSTLFIDLPNLNIPLATTEDNWKEWGETMILENELVNVPLPHNFNNWKNWAEFFVINV